MAVPSFDFDKFRLRTFVNGLAEIGELEVHDEPVAFTDLSSIIEASRKAVLFRKAGPERVELVAAVSGGRRRVAHAFGVAPKDVALKFMERMASPQPVHEIPSGHAPVHERILTGAEIDLSKLPFFLQHELDGGVYISAGIDHCVDPLTGKSNIGCRRLMLRTRDTLRSNLTSPSDLKRIYGECVKRGERLPVSFVIGSHPLDFMTACLRVPGHDELGFVSTMRGEPVPLVRGVTNGVLVPADAEMVIEGYFDELGYREKEGPYGEFWGYYGPVHMDPVFHATAITMRRDALHQSVLHGVRKLGRTDGACLNNISFETHMWRALRAANIEPAALYNVASAPPRCHVRVAIARGVPGRARAVIAALFAVPGVKHVTVVDEDIDIFSDEEVEWAMSTRFSADRDLVVAHGFPGVHMDPMLGPDKTGSKVGFDATEPYGRPSRIDTWRPLPPRIEGPATANSVRDALAKGPLYFHEIVTALGSRDGREIALEVNALYLDGVVERAPNGEWMLEESQRSGGEER